MSDRFYKILERGFLVFFYILLAGLFLKGEVFRVHAKWFSLTFTSVKNFVLVFILWWVVLRIRQRPRISPSPDVTSRLGSLWLLPVLILGIVSILFSAYRIESVRAGWVLLIYIIWFCSIRYVMEEDKHVKNSAILMISLAGVINLANLYFHNSVGLGEILEKYPFWQGKNALALFLVMALCLSGSFPGMTWGINSMLLILGIVFSYSRGAWFSGVIASMGLVMYRFKQAIWLVISCAIIIFIISPALVTERFSSIFNKDEINIRQRLDVWGNAMEMVKKKPLIGTGLGTFTEAYMDNYPDLVPLDGKESRQIRHAHNLYLQFLVETGVFGLVVFVFLIIAGLVYGLRNFIKEGNKMLKSIRYGSLLGIVAFLFYSITDCTTSWRFIGDSFSHINLIWLLLWVIVLRPVHSIENCIDTRGKKQIETT